MDWYPHHIDDYDADTLHLTLAEDGAYSRLLRWYYKNERPLPNDDQALAAICRIGLDEWLTMAPKIRALFVTRDTRGGNAPVLAHKRCDRVILAQNKKRRDWRARQERLRKNGILHDVTRDAHESHAPRGEERRGESISSLRSDIDTPPALTLTGDDQEPVQAKPKTKRGTRLTITDLPQRWDLWAKAQGHPDPQAEWERFRDYWIAQPGKDGVKAEWDATWRNWVRRALQDGRPAVSRTPAVNGTGAAVQLHASFEPYRDAMRRSLGDQTLRGWFARAVLREERGGIVLTVPNKFHQTYIRQNFEPQLNPIFRKPWRIEVEAAANEQQASNGGQDQ